MAPGLANIRSEMSLPSIFSLGSGAPASKVADWAWEVLGLTYVALLASLVFTCLFCWLKLTGAAAASGRGYPD